MAGDDSDNNKTLIQECFNPRPRMAGDINGLHVHSGITVFQSTPAYGGRRAGMTGRGKSLLFQSTPAYGGRP